MTIMMMMGEVLYFLALLHVFDSVSTIFTVLYKEKCSSTNVATCESQCVHM